MISKKYFSVLIFSFVFFNLIGQVENTESLQLTPVFSQTVTPNSDNPFFTVKNLSFFPENELVIFNRWGNEVYKASPYKGNWNCTVKGKSKNDPETLIESGTYFYIFTDKMSQNKYQGYFNLVR